jgi:hypothetical protein
LTDLGNLPVSCALDLIPSTTWKLALVTGVDRLW